MANPFVSGGTDAQSTSTDLPIFQDYAWNFDNDTFIFQDGRHKIVTENEALKVWIYKTLKTERYRYRAYDSSYGIELEQFIGRRPNDRPSAQEVEQYISEALLVNPYITSIDDVDCTNEKDVLKLGISLTTIYGDMTFRINV